MRALQEAKLTEKDVKLVLLQHPDGRTALERGDVDAWAGLDPMMAAAEVESGAMLFYRNAGGQHLGRAERARGVRQGEPRARHEVLKAYEEARAYALANPEELKKSWWRSPSCPSR